VELTIAASSGAATCIGRGRQVNQDAVLARPPVFAVADGMGGHAAGEIASAIAIRAFAAFDGGTAVDAPSVLSAIDAANREILRSAAPGSGREGMGTTLAGIALSRREADDSLMVFNVGDSRVYCCRRGDLRQLSHDHSVIAELQAAGMIGDEARTDPRRNIITRAVGISGVVDVDWCLVDPEPGDRYLCCSDGLSNELDAATLTKILQSAQTPEEAARDLVDCATALGARDDASAVVVAVDHVTPSIDDDVDEDTSPR
jgi:protein phosphatase